MKYRIVEHQFNMEGHFSTMPELQAWSEKSQKWFAMATAERVQAYIAKYNLGDVPKLICDHKDNMAKVWVLPDGAEQEYCYSYLYSDNRLTCIHWNEIGFYPVRVEADKGNDRLANELNRALGISQVTRLVMEHCSMFGGWDNYAFLFEKAMNKAELCPGCGLIILDSVECRNALSRKDNKTYVCAFCGEDEALEDFRKANHN